MRGPRTTMKSGPRLPQLEKALAQKRRPNTAKRKIIKSALPMFSSKSFIVSHLTFRSLIHLSLFLGLVLKNVLISFFFKSSCPDCPAPFVEETVFPTLYSLASFVIEIN